MVINYQSDSAPEIAALLNFCSVPVKIGDFILDLLEEDEGISFAVACAGKAFLEELGALSRDADPEITADVFSRFYEAAGRRTELIMEIMDSLEENPSWGDLASCQEELGEFAIDCLRDVGEV